MIDAFGDVEVVFAVEGEEFVEATLTHPASLISQAGLETKAGKANQWQYLYFLRSAKVMRKKCESADVDLVVWIDVHICVVDEKEHNV